MKTGSTSEPDVLSRTDQDEWKRWAIACVISILWFTAVGTIVSVVHSKDTDIKPADDRSLVFVEIEPNEPEPIVQEKEVTVPEPPKPDKPEPKTPPVPTEPDPPPEKPEPPTPTPVEQPPDKSLPEGEPQKLKEDQRPVTIGMEESSFQQGSDGPMFARGDTARGGRPARRSVDSDDDREAVRGATSDGTGDRPARRPESRRQAGGGSRDPSRASGVGLPEYPPMAEEREIEGGCNARLTVGISGQVEGIKALACNPSGFGFEDSFRTWLNNRLRFKPALKDGQPVEATITYRHGFRLP